MPENIKGLSDIEVRSKQSLGLTNDVIDSYAPTVSKILLRNIFNVINIIVVPLLIFLGMFGLYTEVIAFGVFILINSATSIFDELRIRKEIQKLKSQFQIKAVVIRNGAEKELAVREIVLDDVIKAGEGESIIADGIILSSKYLQLDESVLTGESDYLKKEASDKILSGSYLVTGECYYRVTAVGNTNYINKLAQTSTTYKNSQSRLQKNANNLITFLIIASILLGILDFVVTGNQNSISMRERILSVTAITALIIPQTLIFLFTLTFTISISKLYKKGVLVQKGAAIENLTNIDVICFDKTGTITTNRNKLLEVKYFNCNEKDVGRFYNSISGQFFGVSKTQKLITDHYKQFSRAEITNFDQIPFTSRQKYSLHRGSIDGKWQQLCLGAFEALSKQIAPAIREQAYLFIKDKESQGLRVLVGLYYQASEFNYLPDDFLTSSQSKPTNNIIIYVIEEELNKGIIDLLEKFRTENIIVKIISGDSLQAVSTIAKKVGLDSEKIVDLSTPGINLSDIVLNYDIYTRAKPEDKAAIINALQKSGHNVAMVGDGINDVLGLKAANVSIAMEHGSKITRNISDIVLLANDYDKIPEIFNEGQNIIFNLKLSTKLFLAKSLFAIILAIIAIINRALFPIHPTTTLIFSFFGSSLPSYILIFTREKLKPQKGFFKEIFISALPVAVIIALIAQIIQIYLTASHTNPVIINTTIAMSILGISVIYALNLLQISGRLRSKILALLAFVIIMSLGFAQTIYPHSFPERPEFYIFSAFLFAGLLAALIYGFKHLKVALKLKLGIIFAALIGFAVIMIFPFRTYYHTARLRPGDYLIVLIASLIGLLGVRITSAIGAKFKD